MHVYIDKCFRLMCNDTYFTRLYNFQFLPCNVPMHILDPFNLRQTFNLYHPQTCTSQVDAVSISLMPRFSKGRFRRSDCVGFGTGQRPCRSTGPTGPTGPSGTTQRFSGGSPKQGSSETTRRRRHAAGFDEFCFHQELVRDVEVSLEQRDTLRVWFYKASESQSTEFFIP